MVNVKVLIVAWCLKIVRLESLVDKIKWDVDFSTFSRKLTVIAEMTFIACWVKGASVMSVNRYQHDVLVSLHDMLSTITVMYVPVDNRHSLFFPLL